jgi:hypothetical protein
MRGASSPRLYASLRNNAYASKKIISGGESHDAVSVVRFTKKVKVKVTGMGWPRGFQEVKVPRFLDSGTRWW